MHRLRVLYHRLRQSSWTSLGVRAAIWVGAFLALARVGRGSLDELATPDANAAPPKPVASAAPPVREQPVATAAPSAPVPCPSASAPGLTEDGKVILNTAKAIHLDRLPGVGAKRAAAILTLRTRLGGRFRRVRDLLRVRGIGRKSLKRLKPLVVLDPPEED